MSDAMNAEEMIEYRRLRSQRFGAARADEHGSPH